MPVCVFEWRYGSEEMREVWDQRRRLKYMALVEYALLKALKDVGLIPEDVKPEELIQAAERITLEEVQALEKEIGHDVMAFVEALASKVDPVTAKYIHLGATSYDIIDTTWALQFRDALNIIYKDLKDIINKMIELAVKYKHVPMLGRTHGQWAVPITVGFKFANYVYELARAFERLKDVEKRVVRLKMSGAVGTMAAWGDKGLEVEKKVAEILNMEPHAITTQVAPRDSFAELLAALAILSSVLDRFALEVRELSRPEIAEIIEGVSKKQVGSSTMPHKANPVTSEKISGLAKVSRSLVIGELENIPLWHERDLTNSSSERILIPHSFLTIDEQLKSMKKLLDKLIINMDNIRKNLERAGCLNMAERIMIYLTLEKGLARNEAHKLIMDAIRSYGSLERALEQGHELSKYISKAELDALCDPSTYLGSYDKLIDRAIEYARRVVG